MLQPRAMKGDMSARRTRDEPYSLLEPTAARRLKEKMQSLVVALALTASNALVAKTLPAMRPRAARASVKMELIMPEKDFLIAPSILSADFAKLGAEVDASLAAGADVVHFDVMDNHYVPNLTIGPMVCSALRKHGVTAPIDVHLMVSPVDRIVQDFADAGASYITFHPEASPHA